MEGEQEQTVLLNIKCVVLINAFRYPLTNSNILEANVIRLPVFAKPKLYSPQWKGEATRLDR